MHFKNKVFGTQPSVVHNHSPAPKQDMWDQILDVFFSKEAQQIGPSSELAIISFSTPHNTDLFLRTCLNHLGIPAIIKPLTRSAQSIFTPLCEAIEEASTPYVMFLHPHDALLIRDPISIIHTFEKHFGNKEMLFSGDLVSWPPLPAFMKFEKDLVEGAASDFKHLNGGVWLGKQAFCLNFIRKASSIKPLRGLPHSPQAVLRQIFAAHYPKAQIDHQCRIFQNIGYVNQPIFEWQPTDGKTFGT